MSVHRLLLVADDGLEDSRTDFLWAAPGLPSSFDVSIGPAASELGPVPPPAVDLLRLAILVYLVDRTAPRPAAGAGDRWERQLELVVPVCAPAGDWQLLGPVVGDLLRFLTGDRWTLGFEQGPTLPKLAPPPRSDHVVSLLSGGADSFLGGLLATVRADRPPLLVSHRIVAT